MEALNFGRLEIRPGMRQVWVDGVLAPLGSRAFDLLLLLVTQRDRVVTKDEIFETVWSGLVVEENNLTVQVSALRRAIGANAIVTVTGRGYQFAGNPGTETGSTRPASPLGNLPVRVTPIFGRELELAQVHEAFSEAACVTICGMAGVGKTALAGVAAQRLAGEHRFADGAWLVELTDVRDPALLVQAVCDAVGIALEGRGDPRAECILQLRNRQILLVLDNCEHVIDAAASFVAALLPKAGQAHVLATSQEPLRVAGEKVLRLNPLAVPVSADVDGATDYGAVRMLLACARNLMGRSFEPSPEEIVDLIEVSRQLDGIPLAMELAASRVPLLGIAGVRSRLHDRLKLLSGNMRSAPSRHRSLQAALEWSHQLLGARAQELLHRLALFPGGFSMLGAQLLMDSRNEAEIIEHLNSLVDRSMVSASGGARPWYRLLETTRAFALDCHSLDTGGIDWDAKLARVMAKLCVLVARARDNAWMWQEMPNARFALTWAIGSPGHEETAVVIATYTSVTLSAGGAMREALENLQRVRHLVTDRLPVALVARYWHWAGRLGVEGRLPSSQCIEALQRADQLFAELGEPRQRHACQRHLAEAELRSGAYERAESHIQAARKLEHEKTPPADRMRRLRVEALLADARNQHALALRHAQAALPLAESLGVDRYRLLLMADMAWSHLQMGYADAAVSSFQELLLLLDHSIRQGQARSRALSGLTAALVAAGRIDEAVRSAANSVQALQQFGLLRSQCDVMAWVAAAAGDLQSAAQLAGAAEGFVVHSETERDRISLMAIEKVSQLTRARMTDDDLAYWRAQGLASADDELAQLVRGAFAKIQTAATNRSPAESVRSS